MPAFTVDFEVDQPIPWKVVDQSMGIDMDMAINCAGNFTYSAAEQQDEKGLVGEVVENLQPVLMLMSEFGLSFTSLPHYSSDLFSFMSQRVRESWSQRGIALDAIAISKVELSEEDEAKLRAAMEDASAMGGGMPMTPGLF